MSTSSPTSQIPISEDRRFPYWRANLRVVPLSNLLCSLGFSLSWPFLPLMLRGLGVERGLETWVGNMVLAFYIVSFVMNPIWGGIADHYGRKIMMLRASLGMGSSCAGAVRAYAAVVRAPALLVGLFNGNSGGGHGVDRREYAARAHGPALSLAQTGAGRADDGTRRRRGAGHVVERQHWLFWISGGMLLVGRRAGGVVRARGEAARARAAGGSQWIGPLRELLAVPRLGRCSCSLSSSR